MEGEGVEEIFERCHNKMLKQVGKKLLSNPGCFLENGLQLGSAVASKKHEVIYNTGMQAGIIGVTGRGLRFAKVTQGKLIYAYNR